MPRRSGGPSNNDRPAGVCIVGVGLIGGSLGMALRRVRVRGRRAYHVTGLFRKSAAVAAARRRGAVDAGFTDARAALKDARLVVLCVPVQDILLIARRIAPLLAPGSVVTDVGSVKGPIDAGMKKILGRRRDVSFVGGHPMAGSEKIGVENAEPRLFAGAHCILTPGTGSVAAMAAVRRVWKDAGANVTTMPADVHDHWIAITSHLPHLLAFSLVSQVAAASKRHPKVRSLLAGSFRDMTRIAGSDPRLWSGVLSLNRAALTSALADFSRRAAGLGRLSPNAMESAIARAGADKKALK